MVLLGTLLGVQDHEIFSNFPVFFSLLDKFGSLFFILKFKVGNSTVVTEKDIFRVTNSRFLNKIHFSSNSPLVLCQHSLL